MPERLRRVRRTPELRELVGETIIRPKGLIYPIFVREGIHDAEPIDSMPVQFCCLLSAVETVASDDHHDAVGALLIFGLPSKKNETTSVPSIPNGIVQNAIRAAKDSCPEMVVMTDVC